jgi:hypothetical protein
MKLLTQDLVELKRTSSSNDIDIAKELEKLERRLKNKNITANECCCLNV